MPICEADPWRLQYFEGVPCPAQVRVPTEDPDAFAWNPRENWVYDKMRVAQSQGLAAGALGAMPESYPVFAKPRINLRGMGRDIHLLKNDGDYHRHMTPHHFWSECLTGDHVSTDAAVANGATRWWRHTRATPGPGGTFDFWTVAAAANAPIESYLGAWLAKHLTGYTGMINFETIGGKIIEIHLRFADQWPDLYGGNAWVEAVIRLYERGEWCFDDRNRRDGYSVVLFGEHGVRHRHPPRPLTGEIARAIGISSVQITFHDDKPPEAHAMPPGGFRLAVVNCWDLEAGFAAREILARALAERAEHVLELEVRL